MFSGRNTPRVTIPHVFELFQNVQELGAIFFVFVCYLHFGSPVVIKTAVFSSLDRLVFIHLSKTPRSSFIMKKADGIDSGGWW